MTDTQSIPSTRHIDQSPPYEWHAVDVDGRTLLVRDLPEGTAQLYQVTARSRNVRTFAKADAALYEGNIVRPYYDHDLRAVEFVHDFGGTMDRLSISEWLDEPAIRLKKIPSGSGNIMEATS